MRRRQDIFTRRLEYLQMSPSEDVFIRRVENIWRCFEDISFLLYEDMSQLVTNFILDLGNANFTFGTPGMVPKGAWEIPLARLEIEW